MRELALHILDLATNSIEAGATEIELVITEDIAADRLEILVRDNGRGMAQETVARATDASFTSRQTRRWGLGLPLFKATCERCEGQMRISSAPGEGTAITSEMRLGHLDRPPLGDMGAAMQTLFCNAGAVRIIYRHRVGVAELLLDSAELQAELGEVSVTSPTVLCWIADYVRERLHELGSRA